MRRSGAEASSATSVGLLTTVEVLCPRYSPQSRIGSEVRLESFWPAEVQFSLRVSCAELAFVP